MSDLTGLTVILHGQIPSGKNAVRTTKTGRRYPVRRFKDWRLAALLELRQQVGPGPDLTSAQRVTVDYFPGDRRRRDVPGMMDAICHVLERGQVVRDDAYLCSWDWRRHDVDRENPRVVIQIEELS